jgi:DNA-binding GntR family transcriptional regulator
LPMSLDDRSYVIDRNSPRLLPDQVADDLRALIGKGAVTGKLPTEQELADQYGVARVTIRSAIATLAGEGIIQVIHGRGTFVAR